MEVKKITAPLQKEAIENLKSGDKVLLSGTVYTARDAAHARLVDIIKKREVFSSDIAEQNLPFDIKDQVIYYVGPTPSKPGKIIGSAGPTTSGRMDIFTPTLLENGLKGMIGKGFRNYEVIESIKRNKAVYFAATGGAAALLASHIISCEVIAYEDLGCEAIRRLEVKDLPLVIINDCYGNDFYKNN